MKYTKALIKALPLVVLSMTTYAKEEQSTHIVSERFSGTSVTFSTNQLARNTSITVTGPNDYYQSVFAETGMPLVDLDTNYGLENGFYTYEVTTATGERFYVKDKLNNGRGDNDSHFAYKSVTRTGQFRVVNGQIKQFPQIKEPTSK